MANIYRMINYYIAHMVLRQHFQNVDEDCTHQLSFIVPIVWNAIRKNQARLGLLIFLGQDMGSNSSEARVHA